MRYEHFIFMGFLAFLSNYHGLLFAPQVNLSQLHVPGPPVPLFDPHACKTTACLVNKGIAGAGTPQGSSAEGNPVSSHRHSPVTSQKCRAEAIVV